MNSRQFEHYHRVLAADRAYIEALESDERKATILRGARRAAAKRGDVKIICECGDPDCRGAYKPDANHDLAF